MNSDYFDCAACEKDHSSDADVGDLHYDRSSGNTYFFDGTEWITYGSVTAMSSTGFWPSSSMTWTSGPLGPTATPPPPLTLEPSEYKVNDIPNDDRRVFVANAIEKHTLDIDTVRCVCGISLYIDAKTDQKDMEWMYSLHVADVAVAASDEWDERQMEGESE